MRKGKKEIEHISQLARIELSQKERASLELDFKSILGYIDQIKSVSEFIDATTDTTTGELRNVYREDIPTDSTSSKEVVRLFPKSEQGYLVVKKVLEQ